MKSIVQIVLLASLSLLDRPVWAALPTPYTAAALRNARDAGATVVVDFHASWCPTCRAQAPLLRALAAEPSLKNAVFLVADFDDETELRQQLRVAAQSTIVVFKGDKEAARATGIVKIDPMRALLVKGL